MNTAPAAPAAVPLPDRPQLGRRRAFRAPTVDRFELDGGTQVWLVERHDVPLVSMSLVVPTGSADDPIGKAGLGHITTAMLAEGAGERDAVQVSTAIDNLGADLWTRAGLDGSRVSLSVLKRYLDEAFGVFADVIARPRFDAGEWPRVRKVWLGNLEKRSDDPNSVLGVVYRAVLYGADTPYGHPTSGELESAKTIDLDDIKRHYPGQWRPDVAHWVVAGDVTRAELEALWKKHLADWAAPATPASGAMLAPAPLEQRPRLVLVDRPDSPQAVFAAVDAGLAADAAHGPLVEIVNDALGGSFTSRLNQNLREDHGWTYGARSYFAETRGVGPFVASSAVPVEVCAPALIETMKEIEKMATEGPTAEELKKAQAGDVTELIQTAETVDRLASRLGSLALLGRPPSFDAQASEARQAATLPELKALAQQHLRPEKMSVVVVGPAVQLEPQLRTLGWGDPVRYSPEGRPVP